MVLSASLVVLQQRRTPQSAFAWLLFIVFLPYLGIPLFFALGFRKDHGKYRTIEFPHRDETLSDTSGNNLLDGLFKGYGLPAAANGNKFQLLATGTQAHAALMAEIRGAQRTIDITLYLVWDDAVGRDFVDALTQRQKDGVQVRLLLDWFGSLRRPRKALRRLKHAGGEVRLFSPFVQSPFRGHMDLRNHRKMIIVDSQRAFSGGMNVASNYMGPTPMKGRWVDLAYLLEGPTVDTLCQVFLSDWQTCGVVEIPPAAKSDPALNVGSSTTQLAISGPDVAEDVLHSSLVQAIYSARTEIWIVTPYFLPTPELMTALVTTAHRNVAIHIVVPEKSNQRITDLARGSYLRELQSAGCKIHLCPGEMVHAKAWIMDDTGFIGSANFDVRSLMLNFETMLVLYSKEDVTRLKSWVQDLATRATSRPVPVGRFRRSIEGLFRLGSPFL
ncbi:phospholipase D-like domain-containing protein [Rhodobacteraceae bacterium KMM 6894]|nr:phospholipase D-like domain-containing protein [Rhodobacteraceae bacterium KMM 6894]